MIRVRDAVASDSRAMLEIYNHAVLETTATLDLEPRSLAGQIAWLDERSGGHVVLVAEGAEPDQGVESADAGPAGAQIAGFASLSPFRARAAYRTTVENSIYVRQDCQGLGIGAALMGELLERARQHGFHSVIARIAGDNQASVALHTGLGYRVVGVEHQVGRKFGRWLDVTELQLIL